MLKLFNQEVIMQYRSLLQHIAIVVVLLVTTTLIAGCYTMLSHPSVANDQQVVTQESETTGTSCTTCHNNDYDHNRMTPHYWGFGSWGIRSYPYGYYNNFGYAGYGGYYGWQRYYYDPWWWGYTYDPYPYYYPGGGGGSGGTGSGMSATPDRPETRRGWNGSGSNTQPPPPPPVYIGGSNSGGGSSGGSSGSSGGSSGGSSDDNERPHGRRGSGK